MTSAPLSETAQDYLKEIYKLQTESGRAVTSAKLHRAFDALSFTRRKEYVEGVTGAKRPETRVARIAKVVAALRAQ